jgi:acetolactate synthase-1/2/3 large subunit
MIFQHEDVMTTVANAIVKGLKDAGVDTVFGLPGGETTELMEALRQHGLRFVLTRHEASAAFMAATWARVRRGIAVCLTTLGPGATNALTGAAHAHLDRAPILFISAQFPESRTHTHQLVDLESMFSPVTKQSIRVRESGVHQQLALALDLMKSGRPGPVHLQLSNDVAVAQAVGEASELASRTSSMELSPALGAARQALENAAHPVVLGGLGLEPEGAYCQFQQLAENLASPVILTPKAKGAIPNSHPLHVGTIGLTRTDPAYEILAEADLVIAVGFDVVELVKPWSHPAPLLWVANWPNEDPLLDSQVELVGPMEQILNELSEASVEPDPNWGELRVASFRREQNVPSAMAVGLSPQSVLEIARGLLPADAPVTVDVGSHKILACLEWDCMQPNRFFVSNGLSSMGYGLPAAIGAAMALPESPVLCLTGDAGFAMTMGELGVLAELQAHVIVVVFRDDAMDLIRSHQIRAGKQPFGTEFQNPDIRAVGEAFGLRSFSARTAVEFEAAIEESVSASVPALIEAVIDKYPTTPPRS